MTTPGGTVPKPHGTVLGTTKVVDNGADTSRWCLLIAGDGFTAGEQSDFQTAVDSLVAYLEDHLTGPVNWGKVNVIRLDVESDESGVDVDSYFNASLGLGDVDRGLTINDDTAVTAANDWFPEWDAMLVLVNTTQYAGAAQVGSTFGGGGIAAASLNPTFGNEIALHELGQAAFGLADEYPYLKGCEHDGGAQDDLGAQDIYPNASGEPVEPNVTKDIFSLKWSALVDASTPVPTTTNSDCTECDAQLSPVADGIVGAFEGAHHYHCNTWRPEYLCRMKILGFGFCSVCAGHVGDVLTWSSEIDPSPCFVAGAVYGDRHHPDVVALQRWRDLHLAPGARGGSALALLVAAYDRIGPHLASVARRHPSFARWIRRSLVAPAAAARHANSRR